MTNPTLPTSNNKILLITGINGYIASHIALLALQGGYTLRGTTRSKKSVAPLLQGPFAEYEKAGRVQVYEVPDMTVEGAFDEAVKDVTAIMHTASPINFQLKTADDFILPAIHGTLSMLNSALKHGSPNLKSITVTSSIATIYSPLPHPPNYTFSEADSPTWALDKIAADKAAGIDTYPGIFYTASKMASETALWDWRKTHQPHFSISTIHPGVVIGPPLVVAASLQGLNATLQPLLGQMLGSPIPPQIGSGSYVDVRDVAKMHMWTVAHADAADGERYVGCFGVGLPQAVADILRETRPEWKARVQAGTPGKGYVGFDGDSGKVADGLLDWPLGACKVSGRKAEEVMGFKYVPFKQSVMETAKSLETLL